MNINLDEIWALIAPNWPIGNLIARNPLQGLEGMHFENALKRGQYLFQSPKISNEMEIINMETIKWCQAFFDKGQAIINMPNRDKGFYESWRHLASIDYKKQFRELKLDPLELMQSDKISTLKKLLKIMNLESNNIKLLETMLCSLPGWSGYIKYLALYENRRELLLEYILVRVILLYIFAPNFSLADESMETNNKNDNIIENLKESEKNYQFNLTQALSQNFNITNKNPSAKPEAQFIFCIDVRSEPMRKSIENVGNYETFGFPGFFGLPISIKDFDHQETIASCPVLLTPKHMVEFIADSDNKESKQYAKQKLKLSVLKNFYQSLKYNFSTAFALAEISGFIMGIGSFIKTFTPSFIENLFSNYRIKPSTIPLTDRAISQNEQLEYAKNALLMMGLIDNFAPLIIFCGHKGQTRNNPYQSALDCGACAGHKGGNNAKILAAILNNGKIRAELLKDKIKIPSDTYFLGAQHNTTSDEIEIFDNNIPSNLPSNLAKIKNDLYKARYNTNKFRAKNLLIKESNNVTNHTQKRTIDWSETRPEWGLARNASFIIGPRRITQNIDLDGRTFLHSYDYSIDNAGALLETILTAPVIVAEWINTQYLFSTIDNITYGSGSKITHNITGKIGVIQGNSSDLMHGLPLQSVRKNDNENYHEIQRLSVFVYAPMSMLDKIIKNNEQLQMLFKNEWLFLFGCDVHDKAIYKLDNSLKWSNLSNEI